VCLGALAVVALGSRCLELWRGVVAANLRSGRPYQAGHMLCAVLLAGIAPLVYVTMKLIGKSVFLEGALIAAVVFMLCMAYATSLDTVLVGWGAVTGIISWQFR